MKNAKKEKEVKHIKKLSPKKPVLTNVKTNETDKATKTFACIPKQLI